MVLKKVAKTGLSLLALLAIALPQAQAEEASKPLKIPGLRVAQLDSDDSYDPFADYSEFDEAQDEEADINFFRHGRFVTLGFLGGLRGFTENLGKIYKQGPVFGAYISYFFDLRFALQFSYLMSDHNFSIKKDADSGTGSVSISQFGLDLKYYINTQNVTKGLAKFNPYIIGGFASVQRTTSLKKVDGFGKDNATGWNIGLGIELPMMRNKMFFGAQGVYQLVNFANENTEIEFDSGTKTGTFPKGDSYTMVGILGVNF